MSIFVSTEQPLSFVFLFSMHGTFTSVFKVEAFILQKLQTFQTKNSSMSSLDNLYFFSLHPISDVNFPTCGINPDFFILAEFTMETS